MRKTKVVAVPKLVENHRDLGKQFLLTEWPAARAEKWGIKMLFSLNREGGQIPMDLAGIGIEGVAILGLNTFLRGNINSEEIIPLLDELLECVQIIRDPKHPDIPSPLVSDDDIEDIATRLWLRSEVLELHTGFSPADALSKLVTTIMEKSPASVNTSTSHPE
jgi:hypothetical protein